MSPTAEAAFLRLVLEAMHFRNTLRGGQFLDNAIEHAIHELKKTSPTLVELTGLKEVTR